MSLCGHIDEPSWPLCGILQARILEWVAIPFSKGSSWPRDQTWVSCIAGRFFTVWAIREAPKYICCSPKSFYLYRLYLFITMLLLCSVTQSCLTFCDRMDCSTPESRPPEACSNWCSSSWWCHPILISCCRPFSCLQSFPASGSFLRIFSLHQVAKVLALQH